MHPDPRARMFNVSDVCALYRADALAIKAHSCVIMGVRFVICAIEPLLSKRCLHPTGIQLSGLEVPRQQFVDAVFWGGQRRSLRGLP